MDNAHETFKYIYKPSHECCPSEVLENKYRSVTDLDGRFIAYNGRYHVFDSHQEFLTHINGLPESDRIFHEVSFSQPQKLKFDIDAGLDKLAGFDYAPPAQVTQESLILDPDIMALLDQFEECAPAPKPADNTAGKYNHILDTIRETIRDTFFITFGKDLSSKHEIVCESRSTGEVTKYSNHLIIDGFYVSDELQACEFARKVYTFLPMSYRPFIDMGVYKRTQNFRAIHNHKGGRVKYVVSDHHPLRTLITNITNCELLPDLVSRVETAIVTTPAASEDIESALRICESEGLLEYHKYKFCKKNSLIFMRLRPGPCDFCYPDGGEHTTDNTLVVNFQQAGETMNVFRECRHYIDTHGRDGNHSIHIGSFVSETPAQGMANIADNVIIKSVTMPVVPRSTLFDTLPDTHKNIYNDTTLRPFELPKTLIVHAAMKMGKTKALTDFMARYFPAEGSLRQPVIRFLSFRQTFSGNIKEKFPDFTLYSDVRGPLFQPRLIVQVESLHRLDIRIGDGPPDLLILDECESIFEQFDSGLLKGNFNDCFAKFQYLMRFSSHVVCMDAGISDRTFKILEKMRPDFAAGALYHHNTHQNATDDEYYVTSDRLRWLSILYATVESGECIAVPISSLAEAKALEANLGKRFPEKKIKLYSSGTQPSEKREHFSDVNTYWSDYDVLIYTPTVSAGVSYEQVKFTKIFGYFTDQSCPVETCQQMIGRIRDVSDHKFFICLNASGNNLPVEREDIKSQLYSRRENLLSTFDESSLQKEYGATGEVTYHIGDYFHLWLENTRVRNLSRNSFVRRFIQTAGQAGADVYHLTDTVVYEHTGLSVTDGTLQAEMESLKAQHSSAKVEIRTTACKNISSAVELNDEAVDVIHDLMMVQADITDDQRFAFEKHRLRADYKYEHAIDEKFVEKYYDPKVRRVFKNLSRIVHHATPEDALKQIQEEERENHKWLMSLGETAHQQDLNRKYVFDQHRYAFGLLKLCGWQSLSDPKYIHKVSLLEHLRNGNKLYWDTIGPACQEFGIKAPRKMMFTGHEHDAMMIPALLKPINKILAIMYGAGIITRKKDPDMYFLTINTMFTRDPIESESRKIPMFAPPSN